MPFAPAEPFGSDLINDIFASGSSMPFGEVSELASGITSRLNYSVQKMAGHPDHAFKVASLNHQPVKASQ
jgi:hypothetical protein